LTWKPNDNYGDKAEGESHRERLSEKGSKERATVRPGQRKALREIRSGFPASSEVKKVTDWY